MRIHRNENHQLIHYLNISNYSSYQSEYINLIWTEAAWISYNQDEDHQNVFSGQGRGQGGEMTQTMYAYVNKWIKKCVFISMGKVYLFIILKLFSCTVLTLYLFFNNFFTH
jgi:hypothetical protein